MIHSICALLSVLLVGSSMYIGSTAKPASFILVPLSDWPSLHTSNPPIKLSSVPDGVFFDIDGDGTPEQVSWPSEPTKVAFLAIDRNQSGAIENGSELFGAQMMPGVDFGLTALEKFEANSGDGVLDKGDALFAKLLLWTDANANGRSDSGELTPAAATLAKIGLGYSEMTYRDKNGNGFENRGWVILLKNFKNSPSDPILPVFEVFPAVRRPPTR
jgi:hypothetical protein